MGNRKEISRRTALKILGVSASGLTAAAIVGCGGGTEGSKPTSNTDQENQGGKTPDGIDPITPDPTQPTETVTPTPETEPFFAELVFPFEIYKGEDNDPDYEYLDIRMGLNNPLNLTSIKLGRLTEAPPIATLEVGQYAYEGDPNGHILLGFEAEALLPPGFSARYIVEEDTYSREADERNPLLSYSFRVPKAVDGKRSLIFEDIHVGWDLDTLYPSTEMQYPTSRPDSDFLDLGVTASILIPQEQNDDGMGVLLSLTSITPVENSDYLPSSRYKLYSLKGSAENQSLGYDAAPVQNAFENAFMIADDGGLYLPGHNIENRLPFINIQDFTYGYTGLDQVDPPITFPLSPGEKIEFEKAVLLRKEVTKAKLILPALNNAIINLNL